MDNHWQPKGGSIVVMLDWENFPGIRPSNDPLPLDPILGFLSRHFDVSAQIAYAHRATLSAEWERRLREWGFEIRLLDGLVDANDKKNSLDLHLAMDAVRLSYEAEPEAYALLVAGDKDFAVVAAFIRRRVARRVLGFGSLYCPNPSLAEQVDRYFLTEQEDDWDRQLQDGTGRYIPRPLSSTVKRRAEEQRPYIIAGLVELGPDVPRTVGALMPAILRSYPRYQTGDLRLSTVVEALGCQLSPDRQYVLAWARDLLAAARAHAGERWDVPAPVEERNVSDRARLARLMSCVSAGFEELGDSCRYPLPLSVLHAAILCHRPELRRLLSKRLRLWHVLQDMGFALSEDHTMVMSPESDLSRRVAQKGRMGRQLALFEPDTARETVAREPVFVLREPVDEAEAELAARVRARGGDMPMGPLFAGLEPNAIQTSLPFER